MRVFCRCVRAASFKSPKLSSAKSGRAPRRRVTSTINISRKAKISACCSCRCRSMRSKRSKIVPCSGIRISLAGKCQPASRLSGCPTKAQRKTPPQGSSGVPGLCALTIDRLLGAARATPSGGPHYPFYTGAYLPARTPRAIVDKLHDEVVNALALPSVQERLVEPLQFPALRTG